MHDANTISRTAPCFQPPRFKKKIYSGMILRISDGCFTSKCQRLPQVFRLRESSGSIFKRDRCLPLYASACVRITSSWLVGYIESIEHERIMHVALPTRTVSHATLQRQEAQLSPMDRAMRRVSWSLANCHATVQKLLVRQVLNQVSAVASWPVRQNRAVDSASVR